MGSETEPDPHDTGVAVDGVGAPEGHLAELLLGVRAGAEEPTVFHADGEGFGCLVRAQVSKPIPTTAVLVDGQERPAPLAEPHAVTHTKRVVVGLQSETGRHLNPLRGGIRESDIALTPALGCQRPD